MSKKLLITITANFQRHTKHSIINTKDDKKLAPSELKKALNKVDKLIKSGNIPNVIINSSHAQEIETAQKIQQAFMLKGHDIRTIEDSNLSARKSSTDQIHKIFNLEKNADTIMIVTNERKARFLAMRINSDFLDKLKPATMLEYNLPVETWNEVTDENTKATSMRMF